MKDTRAERSSVLLCIGALSLLASAGVAGAASPCTSSFAERQADVQRAATYLISLGREPSRAVAVVNKQIGPDSHDCW